MSRLKWSYYNIISDIKNGMLIFNSSTGSVVKITDTLYLQKIIEYINADYIDYSSKNDDAEGKFIRNLMDKRFLVDVETNELDMLTYVYNNQIIRNSLLELTLIVTRQCNYRCVYCYEDHLDLPMSDEVYNSLLSYIEKAYTQGHYSGVSVALFGGEPLLEFDKCISFLKTAYELSKKYGKTFSAGATTNGSLLFPERFRQLNELNCRHFQITLDGLQDTHDNYRISVDGNGWDVVVNNLKYMASTDFDFDVTIRTNFNDEILNQADSFYSLIHDIVDERFNIYYEGIKHLGGDNDEQVSVMDNVAANISMIDIADLINKYKLKNNVCTERLLPFSHICQATKYNSYIVDYDGTLLKCTLDFNNEANKIGYISSDGDMYINHEKHCKWLTVGYENNENCRRCRLLPLCYGRRCVSSILDSKTIECNPEVEEMFLIEQIKNNYCSKHER